MRSFVDWCRVSAGMIETHMTEIGVLLVAMKRPHVGEEIKHPGVTADLVVAMTTPLGGVMTMVQGQRWSGHASSCSRAASPWRRRVLRRGPVPYLVVPSPWIRRLGRRRLQRSWRRSRRKGQRKRSRET